MPFVASGGRLSPATRAFDALPGKSVVGIVTESPDDRGDVPRQIRVVLNWYDELKRLVPPR